MQWQIHEVTNQMAPLQGYNLFATDIVLVQDIQREQTVSHAQTLTRLGTKLGSRHDVPHARKHAILIGVQTAILERA